MQHRSLPTTDDPVRVYPPSQLAVGTLAGRFRLEAVGKYGASFVVAEVRNGSHSPIHGKCCKDRCHRIFFSAPDMAHMPVGRTFASIRVVT